MTPKQRAVAALTLQIPDQVPTFELEFQLSEEMFGRPLLPESLRGDQYRSLSRAELERQVQEAAEFAAEVYSSLDYCIIPAYGPGCGEFFQTGLVPDALRLYFDALHRVLGGTRMLGFHGDGTFAIPDGNGMYEFSYMLTDDPEGMLERAERSCVRAIERNKRLMDAGVEVLLLCSDYCFNNGPFVSPRMFERFVTPYLARIIASARENGQFAIKHTDGNIMPILDQLVSAHPHALHSIDPMAGVDIREVKRLVGDQVALCGNVHCAAMQTGTLEDVENSARYCLTHAKPGGGYIFCTSNIPFKGLPPERYQFVLDIWRQMRDY